jgi:1,4-dihydroxy-2-naphthoate octaprenyltransferase
VSTSVIQPSIAPIAPGSLRAWILASRPKTLPAAIAPVCVGTACAYDVGRLDLPVALAALLGACLLQIGSNFTNDVFDYEKGADTDERLGPTRAVQAGLLTPLQMRWGMVSAFGLALLVGIYLTWVAGSVVIWIGLASIAAAIAYTAGPLPLGYHGLGDLFVMAFFGFVAVCGTAFVQVGSVPPLAWVLSVPIGALATGILVVNNVRDRETDVKAGKRTLPVRFGRAAGVAEYGLLLLLAYATPIYCWGSGQAPLWILLPAVTLPLGVSLLRQVSSLRGAALNRTLANTAKLLFVFGVLLSLGVTLGHLSP